MAEETLKFDLTDSGLLYYLNDGIKLRVRRKSPQRQAVAIGCGSVFIPPQTGDLETATFREKLVTLAAERFGEELGDFASELDHVALKFSEHLDRRQKAAREHHDSEADQPDEFGGTPYRIRAGGFSLIKFTQAGEVEVPLTNFVARIVRDVAEDDGAEVRRAFEMEAELRGRRHSFVVPAERFASMNWSTEHLGASAIVYAGQGNRDHARVATQLGSGRISTVHVYAHTGWRQVNDQWVYLHAGGGIGRDGRVEDVRVGLSGTLEKRELPKPREAEEEFIWAIRTNLGLWELAPENVTVPLWSGIYRAVLGDTDFSLHLSGPTGEGKSELAALCQQHYGSELDARHLTSWESTENAIEGQAFGAKDQMMVLDDFAPTGSSYDVQRWHKKADRVLRAKGNASSRQRMRPDTTLRPEKPPRALILSTGEDVPRGQSLRARMLVLELSPGDLDWKRLSRCQRDAASGMYAVAMAGFVQWLAPRYEEIRPSLRKERAALREWAARSTQHKRTPGIVADLALGLRYFLLFAHDAGALTAEEAERLWLRGWGALGEAATAQRQHQVAGEPTRRFGELLSAAIASGRAHIAGPEGDEPEEPGAWGWRHTKVGTGDFEREEWRPLGERVGWVEGDALYLLPDAAYAAIQRQGRDSGEPLTVTERTLRKRLHERGLLLSVDDKRQVLTTRRKLESRRRGVLHLSPSLLSSYSDQPDQPDHGGEEAFRDGRYAPSLWSGSSEKPDHNPTMNPTTKSNGRVTDERWLGSEAQPDHGPDHEESHSYAGNSANGRVGRVSEMEEEGLADEEEEVTIL